jgi:hypothetical protein
MKEISCRDFSQHGVVFNFYGKALYARQAVTIDLVLKDQQSVEKRSLHLMDTVNAKKRWTTIYWRVNNF